jgi:phage-related minor tail protein
MGEAGPEAIMPLKRTSSGELGVVAEGSGTVVVHQNFNFQANGDESVKRIIAQAAPQISKMTQRDIVQARKQGGTMKAVFS